MLEQIKRALFQDDPEWAAAYNKQLKALSREETVMMMTRLDTVFWSLTAEGTDPDEVKGEVEHLFQQLRTQRCQQQLRDQILPLIRKLPRECHKDVLAEVMDFFGDLTLSDEEVLQHAANMVANLKLDSPPKPAPVPKDERDSREGKKSKGERPEAELGGEGDTKKKKKKKPKEGDVGESTEATKKGKKTKKGAESRPQSPQGTENRVVAATSGVAPAPPPKSPLSTMPEPKAAVEAPPPACQPP
eukprot:EG_transcript_20801